MRILVLLSLLEALAAGADLKVLYTGKLLGYGRACFLEEYVPIPGQPGFYNRQCVTPQNDYSVALQKLLKAEKGSGALLLGTGDHFSLDFGARNAILNPSTPSRQIVGREEMFYIDGKGWVWLREYAGSEPYTGQADTTIDGETVADFLVATGYDALVPGKHDFYFGAERLRQIARLLGKSGVRMMADNLVIRAERVKAVAQLPAVKQFRKTNFERTDADMKITLPSFVLPWMRRVRIENSMVGGSLRFKEARICEATDVDHHNCPSAAPTPDPLRLISQGNDDFFIQGDTMLEIGKAYHICVVKALPAKAQSDYYCQAFEVERPFFDYGSTGSQPLPYIIKNEAVIFGAVALGLEKHIGKLNTQWLDPKGEFEMQAVALDPVEALRQALDFCESAGDCGDRRKILLAQMPAVAAHAANGRLKSAVAAKKAYATHMLNRQRSNSQAIGKLPLAEGDKKPPFALVVSEADSSSSTPFDRVEYPAEHPPLIVTPKPPYIGGMKLSVHVQFVTMRDDKTIAESTKIRDDAEVATAAFQENMGTLVASALAQKGLKAARNDPATDFRYLTLAVMRSHEKASVALLQKRDLFEAKPRQSRAIDLGKDATSNDQIHAAVDGILWKGDFLVRRYLKGSALKKVMTQAGIFDRLDQDDYGQEDESERGLLALGISRDETAKSWVVDGALIEDEKMYMVATTDYLAFGDTGYPDLNQPATGNPQRASEMKNNQAIANLVYQALIPGAETKPVQISSTNPATPAPGVKLCSPTLILDCLSWTPAPSPPMASVAQQFENYFKSPPTPALPEMPKGEKSINSNETKMQLRPIWKLAVEKANFSINRYRHNQGNQSTLSKNFSGVPESGVSAQNSETLGWEWAAELRHERFRSMDFLRLEGVFSQSDTQQKDDSFLKSYAQNSATVEVGWRRAFGPAVRQRPWKGVLLSGVVGTQQFNPRSLASVNYTAPVPPADPLALGTPCTADSKGQCSQSYYAQLSRTSRAAIKAGVRRESRDTWFEAGLFKGIVNRPVSYQIGQARICDLRTETLSACLKSLVLPAPFQGTAQQTSSSAFGPETGIFFNFNWNMPVMPKSKMKIELTNRGRYYFNHSGDTRFDTRLSNIFTAAFSAPIAGGLTFKPTYTLFHFENKPNTASIMRSPEEMNLLMGNTVELKLNYSFDWRSGQSWGKALRYGNGK